MLLEKDLYLIYVVGISGCLTGVDQSNASFANYSVIAKLISSLVCYLAH